MPQAKQKPPDEDPEVKLGRENSIEAEKPPTKLVADAALLERVNRIGQDIAAVANTQEVPATWGSSTVKKFPYTFKIVDDKEVNAFSLPGGFIYVNKGTLDYCHSDDELAGVIGHEVAHAAHHHMMKLMREQNKIQPLVLAAILAAAVLGGHSSNGSDTIGVAGIAANLYMVAKLNSYGVEAEKDADQSAVRYLVKTKYNPVGLLTFMERLARDESRQRELNLGIYKTHPPSPERAASLRAELDQMGIPLNRRAVDPAQSARVSPVTVNGAAMQQVAIDKVVVARFVDYDGIPAPVRAKQFAEALNALLDGDLQMYEVKATATQVIARGHVILSVAGADASAMKAAPEKVAADVVTAIRNVIWQAQFNRVPAAAGGG